MRRRLSGGRCRGVWGRRTESARAGLFGLDGRLLAEGRAGYPTVVPRARVGRAGPGRGVGRGLHRAPWLPVRGPRRDARWRSACAATAVTAVTVDDRRPAVRAGPAVDGHPGGRRGRGDHRDRAPEPVVHGRGRCRRSGCCPRHCGCGGISRTATHGPAGWSSCTTGSCSGSPAGGCWRPRRPARSGATTRTRGPGRRTCWPRSGLADLTGRWPGEVLAPGEAAGS